MIKTTRLRFIGFVFSFAVVASGLFAYPALASHQNPNGTLKTYSTNLSGAYAFGDDFCSHSGNMVGDYVWITAAGGGNVIKATAGDKTVQVVVHWGGRYCKKGIPNSAYSTYTSQTGSISGTTDSYGDNDDATLRFSGSETGTLDIDGQKAGEFNVCITLTTYTDPDYGFVPSPSACTKLVLELTYPWTTSGVSRVGVVHDPNVSSWDAVPGQWAVWDHTITNNSGHGTAEITPAVGRSGFRASSGLNGNKYPWGEPDAKFSLSAWGSYAFGNSTSNYTSDTYFKYTINQDDVGAGDKFNDTWEFAPAICQYVSWGPWDGTKLNEWKDTSPGACVRVPYNFNLSPSIGDLGMQIGDQDGTIPTVRAIITNGGPTKSYINTHWQLSKIIVKAGDSIPNGTDNKQDGCAYYGNDCETTDGYGSGGADSSFGVTATTVSQLSNQPIGDLEVGDRLCYGMSVMAYKRDIDNNSGDWRHSAPQCVIVGKKPKVQIWGSDLSVGRRFDNDASAPSGSSVDVSTSIKAGNTKVFGSWVEYGVFATGTITGGSAAGLAGQDGHGPGTQADWSKLTFANAGHTPVSGCNGALKFGCYATAGNLGTIPNVAARLAPKAVTSTPSLSGSTSLDGLNDTYYVNGNLQINGGAIAKGRSVVIKASGTVFIDGDIRYTTDSLASTDEIPQVVIIANSIQIKDTVTNVDAWLIANGTQGSVHTCNNRTLTSTPVLTSGICDKKLTVNGPVMAKKLYLTRTAGSGTGPASGEPGEVLNLRADAYLWAIGRAGGEGSVQTIDTRELAPRF